MEYVFDAWILRNKFGELFKKNYDVIPDLIGDIVSAHNVESCLSGEYKKIKVKVTVEVVE
jgi:hypothetical protein